MAVKDSEKNKEYVAKHRKAARATMGDEEYKKKEAEARALRRKKAKAKQVQEAITLPPLKPLDINELFETHTLKPLDINNLINLLPSLPAMPKLQEKKTRTRKQKPKEEITDNMSFQEKRKIYMREYMREYKKLQKK
jgi:hypothetical protein